jgi:hypothetical protein
LFLCSVIWGEIWLFVLLIFLTASLDCPFLITLSVFSNVYISIVIHILLVDTCKCLHVLQQQQQKQSFFMFFFSKFYFLEW